MITKFKFKLNNYVSRYTAKNVIRTSLTPLIIWYPPSASSHILLGFAVLSLCQFSQIAPLLQTRTCFDYISGFLSCLDLSFGVLQVAWRARDLEHKGTWVAKHWFWQSFRDPLLLSLNGSIANQSCIYDTVFCVAILLVFCS